MKCLDKADFHFRWLTGRDTTLQKSVTSAPSVKSGPVFLGNMSQLGSKNGSQERHRHFSSIVWEQFLSRKTDDCVDGLHGSLTSGLLLEVRQSLPQFVHPFNRVVLFRSESRARKAVKHSGQDFKGSANWTHPCLNKEKRPLQPCFRPF